MIEHPREGYAVELWHGRFQDWGLMPPHTIDMLVEIVETYNQSGQFIGYHYRPHDLAYHKSMEIKTIGSLGTDRERAAKRAQDLVGPDEYRGQVKWTRLR